MTEPAAAELARLRPILQTLTVFSRHLDLLELRMRTLELALVRLGIPFEAQDALLQAVRDERELGILTRPGWEALRQQLLGLGEGLGDAGKA